METNPETIQPAVSQEDEAVAVFLIHDGGGTIFSYHCLAPLHRPVYGIYNPNFSSGEPFDGGLCDMARFYVDLVVEAVGKNDFPKRYDADGNIQIILGGWSMGGHLSLEMAHQLDSKDTDIKVIGILMIDTVYPQKQSNGTPRKTVSQEDVEGQDPSRILADRAMADANRMIDAWTPPVWNGDSAERRPRITLLRAKESVPLDRDGTMHLGRKERNLGWDTYENDLFFNVADIEGNHFEIFAFRYLDGISDTMKAALDALENAALKD
ncbi:putative secondary metabolism biosynthetic enzyme [Fusarium musae]|uniref:Secondary metabolism biosynthetic enzyme n=1 Tax=Fusarium musae TaxID=1042133 RepID=A0A9P8DAN7_9HYPO|nr:putative secondary metabolism biosynthetic enzyme [Fusarium musae]KAG9498346.1 putative secondary metabolism biosynthetic enzyme [Fusarium musae]